MLSTLLNFILIINHRLYSNLVSRFWTKKKQVNKQPNREIKLQSNIRKVKPCLPIRVEHIRRSPHSLSIIMLAVISSRAPLLESNRHRVPHDFICYDRDRQEPGYLQDLIPKLPMLHSDDEAQGCGDALRRPDASGPPLLRTG